MTYYRTYPHCDASVLHAPGECTYCDQAEDLQAIRRDWGIAFTGHQPVGREIACPSDFRRGLGEAGKWWPGNAPKDGDS